MCIGGIELETVWPVVHEKADWTTFPYHRAKREKKRCCPLYKYKISSLNFSIYHIIKEQNITCDIV